MNHVSNKELLSKYTAEFTSVSTEDSFLRFSWNYNKYITRNALLIIGFIGVAFFIRDVLEVDKSNLVHSLLYLRLFAASIVVLSAYYIHRSKNYFSNYSYLLLFNQLVISLTVFLLAIMRNMPIAYLGVNTILFTLIFYQFMNNRFYFSLIACFFLGIGAVITGYVFLNMNASEFIGTILFLIPINYLGITMMHSINKTRRYEYLALIESRKSNARKEELIKELRETLAEVKTLRGFLPICSNCKKIRDDEGYWNQIESYIKARSDVEFSHSICPVCVKELYGDQEWYKKKHGED